MDAKPPQVAVTTFVSAFLSSTITYPLEVRKTRVQTVASPLLRDSLYGSSRRMISLQYASSLLSNHYAGFRAHALCYPTFWTAYFLTSEHLKKLSTERQQRHNIHPCAIAFASAFVGTTIANPFFVVKNRMQAATPVRFVTTTISVDTTVAAAAAPTETYRARNSVYQMAREIFITEGRSIKPFASGWAATQMNNSKLVLQMPLYEFLIGSQTKKNTNSATQIVVAATVSKVITSSLFYPFDLVRTRQRNGDKRSVLTIMRDIAGINVAGATATRFDNTADLLRQSSARALRGLYRGILPYSMATVPNFVLMMFIKDYILLAFAL